MRDLRRLSQEAADFMLTRARANCSQRCLGEYRSTLWTVIEFFAGDPYRWEVTWEDAMRFKRWLREVEVKIRVSRPPGSTPEEFTPAGVQAFLQRLPHLTPTGRHRTEQTIQRHWRYARQFFRFLGLRTETEAA